MLTMESILLILLCTGMFLLLAPLIFVPFVFYREYKVGKEVGLE